MKTMTAVVASAGMTMALSACLTNECSHLSDCGDGERCGLDGVCVPADGALTVGAGATSLLQGAPGEGTVGAGAAGMTPDETANEDWSGVRWRVVSGAVRGNVAGLALDTVGNFAPADGVAVVAEGVGGDGLLLVYSLTPDHWDALVRSPGAHTFSSSDMDAPVFGATCTLNETSISHYDEPAQVIDIVVEPPAADGTVTVSVDVQNTLSDAGVTMVLAPVD